MVKGPLDAARMVYPSGSDLATESVPMEPPAPALFSITTDWPKILDISCATTRPAKSVACPGGQGTIIFKGRLG